MLRLFEIDQGSVTPKVTGDRLNILKKYDYDTLETLNVIHKVQI